MNTLGNSPILSRLGYIVTLQKSLIMSIKIEASWKEMLRDEFSKEYFENLIEFVKQEYATKTCYPPGNKIFAAFDRTPFEKVKVVILGQDPYHGAGQANGLMLFCSRWCCTPTILD